MALNTRDKRASSIAIKQVFIVMGPNPDGALATGSDRQIMAREYAGIAASAAVHTSIMMRYHHHYARP